MAFGAMLAKDRNHLMREIDGDPMGKEGKDGERGRDEAHPTDTPGGSPGSAAHGLPGPGTPHPLGRMTAFTLGIDVGTSGVRALALDPRGRVIGMGEAPLSPTVGHPRREQEPSEWARATWSAIRALGRETDLADCLAVAVDGTSGTLVPVDANGRALARARMYDDADTADLAEAITRLAPAESAAHGASSPAARARQWVGLPGLRCVLHQADWVARQLGVTRFVTDENNALKTGYDPIAKSWPAWLESLGLPRSLLPEVVPAGSRIGAVSEVAARETGLPAGIPIAAGTTDGCATFLASGAARPGEGVTALGSTLVLKVLSETPIFAPALGIYSHPLGSLWLAGGASNCGGRTLLAHFTKAELAELEPCLRPEEPTGLDYYPLPAPGERFPVADARLQPRLDPRPTDRATFLQGILEGLARVEANGYLRLRELGAPAVTSVRHAGGGGRSPGWMRLRSKALEVPLLAAESEQAAAGAARLAWRCLGIEPGERRLRRAAGLSELAGRFRLLLVDQFGTLHDGTRPYPGAAEALRRFRETGGRVIVLSNSAKPGPANLDRLRRLGFGPEAVDAVVTSGDALRAALEAGEMGPAFSRGSRVLAWGRPGDDYGLSDLGFAEASAEDAEGVILAASREPEVALADQLEVLAPAARRGATFLLGNPDLEMLTPSGIRPSAGALAAELAQLGARVHAFGKPHLPIYRLALRLAGQPAAAEVLAIGDSPEHDLEGARAAGISGALVRTGLGATVAADDHRRLPPGDWLELESLRW